jgi:hypothetical protein
VRERGADLADLQQRRACAASYPADAAEPARLHFSDQAGQLESKVLPNVNSRSAWSADLGQHERGAPTS